MSNLRSKVNKALEAIGTKNGTAPVHSQDPIDNAAHELNVAAIGRSHFDKRYKEAKDRFLDVAGVVSRNAISSAQGQVEETGLKQDIEVARGANHIVLAEVKNGASYLDTDALKVILLKKFKTSEVDAMFEQCMKRRSPSVSFKVIEV